MAQTQTVNWKVPPEIKKWTTTTGQQKDNGLLRVITSALHLPAEGFELRARVSSAQHPEKAETCLCSGHCLCLADIVVSLVQTPVIWVVIFQTYLHVRCR